MASKLFVAEQDAAGLRVCSDVVTLRTEVRRQFVDLTALVAERVRRSRITHGLVSVQSRHTTAAVVVNENEPRLLEDMKRTLERLVPCDLAYGHDDLQERPEAHAEERANGEAHCKALLLRASESLAVMDGEVTLGSWQSVFLVELDGPRARTVSITVIGVAG
jgi:secondary thiamine-phosphate synthase enzyme